MVIMGNVTVLVPPDVRIECDGDAIIGSFEMQGQKWSTPGPNAPTVLVAGTAFLGSVEIKVVNPNAPSWIKQLKARWAQLNAGA
jgi:predicted membrane protein